MRKFFSVPCLALTLLGCARAEPFQARFTVRGRWPGERSISYRLEPEHGALAPERFQAAIEEALSQWQATGCARFRQAGPGETPALVFAWHCDEHERDEHDDCAPFGTDPSVAHAGPVGPGTFVHFDAGRDWNDGALSLHQAALHEVGHVLGLDHSSDEASVMFAQPSPGRSELAPSDLAALHSLYGGGTPARGDLDVDGEGEPLTLHAVAPPELTRWTLADTDGDGDEEVLVWRIDPAGHGALWIHHFAPGPRLERTLGPLYGVAHPEPAAEAREFQRGDLDGDGHLEAVTRRRSSAERPSTAGHVLER